MPWATTRTFPICPSDLPALNVHEIFYSLQGESTRAGLPCVFVRLSGCNLRCAWCDTPASWQDGTSLSIPEILASIAKYPCQLVEVTGGEPLLQKDTIVLLRELIEQGYEVMLETNGSLPLNAVPDEVIKIVDVKCPGSGYAHSFLPSNLECMNAQDELKFVLASREDYDYALRFIREHELWGQIILFSPAAPHLEASLLAEWMLKDGIPARLQIQLHRVLGMA